MLEVVDGDGHGFVMVMSGYVDMKNGMEIYVLRGIAVQPYFNLFAESAQGVDPLHLFSNSYSILSSEIRKNVSSPEAERYFEYSTSTKNATYSHLAPKKHEDYLAVASQQQGNLCRFSMCKVQDVV